MSAGVYRAAALSARTPWRALVTPKTFYHTKPPKGVGPFETFVALSILSLGVLSPAAWILSTLPEQPKH